MPSNRSDSERQERAAEKMMQDALRKAGRGPAGTDFTPASPGNGDRNQLPPQPGNGPISGG